MASQGPGVLIKELISGDGPHGSVADDFLHRRCSQCGEPTEGDFILIDGDYHCRDCMSSSWEATIALGQQAKDKEVQSETEAEEPFSGRHHR